MNFEKSAQDKISAIMETETISNETKKEKKEKKEMNFNLPIEKETETETNEKSFNLPIEKGENKKTISELKKEKSQIEKAQDLTLGKFAQVETILEKINDIDQTFIDFLNNQKETLEVLNNFNSFRNEIETYFSNFLRNQKSILNAINSLNGNFKKSISINTDIETETEKEIETETKKGETKLKKNIDNINPYQKLFDLWNKEFKGNFLGEKELNENNMEVWQALIDYIDETSADTIETSIKEFRSKFTKSNNGSLLNAKRSNKKFINCMISAIETFNKTTIKREKAPSETINKAYFTSKFEMKLKDLDNIISKVKAYGKIDETVKETIKTYALNFNSNIENKIFETFYIYLENFI